MSIGWERLNAYVDRELAPAEAAEVAAAIARDPDLAARAATLSGLKAGVAGADLLADAAPPPAPVPRNPAGARMAVIAAIVVFALIAAGALWHWLAPAAAEDAWLADAVAGYESWLAADAGQPGDARIRLSVQEQQAEQVPDLSAAKLTLVHVSLAPAGEGSGLFLGYEGIHGCRLGLWIGATDAALNDQPAAISSGALTGYAWRVDKASYALLSRGMDMERLKLFAQAVSRITHQQQRLDDAARVALSMTTGVGAPCHG
ncbi:MAG: anti-sigma factor [Dongiaceae bacterium]